MAPPRVSKADILKNKRASYIDQIDRMVDFANNDELLDQVSVAELQIRLKSIEKIHSNFEGVQGELEGALYDDETAQVRQEFEESYLKLNPKVTTLINARLNAEQPNNAAPIQVQQNPVQHQTVKLPELGLPSFSGDYTKWTNFITRFNSSIHSKQGLSNSDKFQYLVSVLSGPASKIIDSIEISNENYEVALTLLKERFDNRPLIVQEHIKELFHLKPVEKGSRQDLRNLIDSFNAHLRALQSLDRPTDQWDDLIIYLIVSKLDYASIAKWQEEAPANRHPTLADLFATLTRRCHVLENTAKTSFSPTTAQPSTSTGTRPSTSRKSYSVTSTKEVPTKEKCAWCDKSNHKIYRCDRFEKLTPAKRLNEAKRLNLCTNCLKPGHSSGSCPSTYNCKKCLKTHHTLLHLSTHETPTDWAASSSDSAESNNAVADRKYMSCSLTAEPNAVQLRSIGECHQGNYVFLATAIVNAENGSGQTFSCRVLLDSGSQINFITERLAHQMQLNREKSDVSVSGIGGRRAAIKHRTFLTIRSRINNFVMPLEAHILSKITEHQPDRFVDVKHFVIPSNLSLADPKFNIPQKIDILIGAEHYFNLLSIGQINATKQVPILQNTVFGWVVSGQNATPYTASAWCHVSNSTLVPLDKQLQQFWEIEQPTVTAKSYSHEDDACEQKFRNTVTRNEEGRYIVRLPFKIDPKMLGNSLQAATKRFYNLERRFEKHLELKGNYSSFMAEYIRLGHMDENLVKRITDAELLFAASQRHQA